MCCIFGMGLFKGHNFRDNATLTGIVSRFFKEAESGGRKASGLSIMKEHSVHVLRRPLSASQLIASDEYSKFMEEHIDVRDVANRMMSIIGHCRWPTQGSIDNNLNNHPQVVGNMIGVHNGVISNDHELFKSFGDRIERLAEVDTEIIFSLINYFNDEPGKKTITAMKQALPFLRGGYACGMQNVKHPYNLYLFRRGNPITIERYPKLGMVFFGTRGNFMRTAVDDFIDYGGKSQDIPILDKEGHVFNMWDNTMCKFNFNDDKDPVVIERGDYAG